MISANCYVQELPVTTIGYSTLFGHCLDTAGVYEDRPPLLEAISYLCPESNPYSPYQDDAFHDTSVWPYENDEVYPLVSSYQQDQLPYNSWRNWDGEYESCFTFGGYFDDYSFSYENSTSNNEHGNVLQKTEDCLESEGHTDSYINSYHTAERQLYFDDCFSFDDCLWSGHESWLGNDEADDFLCYARQKPSNAYSYSMDEIGACESIFGYWPSLIQKHPRAYSE